MRVTFCGVRGSTAAPGPEFIRHGGHTSCVAITHDDESRPRLILDAGTGIRRVTALLGEAPFRGTILLGHLHWDHLQGLPFFGAGDRPDASVRLLMPMQGDPLAVLRRTLSPPHFPIGLEDLRGDWRFSAIDAGGHDVEGFSVTAREIPHKGGRTFGYRVSDGRGAVAYLSDHSPIAFGPGVDGLGEYHEAACELADGADLLIHDAQHTAGEFPERSHFGHAAVEYAVGLAETCGVGRLALFHHDPARTDEQLDRVLDAVRGGTDVPVDAATEGTTLSVG